MATGLHKNVPLMVYGYWIANFLCVFCFIKLQAAPCGHVQTEARHHSKSVYRNLIWVDVPISQRDPNPISTYMYNFSVIRFK